MGNEIRDFLESTPIGKSIELEVAASPRKKFVVNRGFGGGRTTEPSAWVVPIPRLRLFCSECNGSRNFNPSPSYLLAQSCLELGQGPRTLSLGSGKEILTGQHVDQFLRLTCGDCNKEIKKYALAVEVLSDLPSQGETAKAALKLTKFGEIPKPIKPINAKIKRLIKAEWEMYRKGADEQKAQESKESRHFTESIAAVDHLFPSELKFNNQNALLALYGPLSEGLHGRFDEECLEAASHIRTLLDALGERLEQVIDQEDSILNALKGLQRFSTVSEAEEPKQTI